MPRPVSDDDVANIRNAILAGRKIEAIKIYRTASGEGLKEAKDFVEAIEAELRRTEPGAFTAPPGGKGCGTAVFCLVAVAVITAAILQRM